MTEGRAEYPCLCQQLKFLYGLRYRGLNNYNLPLLLVPFHPSIHTWIKGVSNELYSTSRMKAQEVTFIWCNRSMKPRVREEKGAERKESFPHQRPSMHVFSS